MRDAPSHSSDLHFAQELLEGNTACLRRFQETFRPRMVSFLTKSGATEREAEEIAGELWTDCLVPGSSGIPTLARYSGSSSLFTWLSAMALNNLVTRRRREARWMKLFGSADDPAGSPAGDHEGEAAEAPSDVVEPAKAPLLAIMRDAIDSAFQECPAEDFVLLQLAHCDGLKLKELGLMFQCDAATISRRLQRAGTEINRATLLHIKKADGWLELNWEDFIEMCRFASPASFGEMTNDQ